MGPGDVFALLIVVALPTLLIVYLGKRFFAFREKQLEVDARLAADPVALRLRPGVLGSGEQRARIGNGARGLTDRALDAMVE